MIRFKQFLKETPDVMDTHQSSHYRKTSRDQLNNDKIFDSDGVSSLLKLRPKHSFGDYHFFDEDRSFAKIKNSKILYLSYIRVRDGYIYQGEAIKKRRAVGTDSKEIFEHLIMLAKKLGYKGLKDSGLLSLGGVHMWKVFIQTALDQHYRVKYAGQDYNMHIIKNINHLPKDTFGNAFIDIFIDVK